MKKLTPLEVSPVRNSRTPTTGPSSKQGQKTKISNSVSRLPRKTRRQREFLTGLRARFKLWLSTKDIEGVFGDGKWRLLKAVQSAESLSAASKSLRISYRKAWGDLKKAQEALNLTLVEKTARRYYGRPDCSNQRREKMG